MMDLDVEEMRENCRTAEKIVLQLVGMQLV